MSLYFLLMLHVTVAAVVQRAGEDVTLTCEHELEGQRDCNGTIWNYGHGRAASFDLVEIGKIENNGEIESERLRVTANCSLIIKKVTVQDVGHYYCEQYKSDDSKNHILVHWSVVHLSVATIVTEQEVDDEETLKCFVMSSEENCEQEVKWMIKDQDIDEENSQIKTEKNECSATVTLKKSHYLHPQTHFLSCEVTDWTGEKLRFSPRPSDRKSTVKPETLSKSTTTGTSGASADPQGDTKSTVKPENFSKSTRTGTSGASADPQGDTESTVKPETFSKSTTTGTSGASADPQGDTKSTVKPETLSKSTTTGTSGASADPQGLSRNLAVSLGLAALVLCVVTVNMWARIKEQQIQKDGTTAYKAEFYFIPPDHQKNEAETSGNCRRSLSQDEEDEAAATYENLGEPSASVRLH
ncbi:uncharacterized protein LOC115402437 isoform X2 [Salarias fasciatus]|uniref:uncharacterized protein LOC115402437 isoform X2 n=1 Tax=Salarias fasciatus TaxID=181472 RepID=UPI001176C3FA|nr:uncharacterized protein LOC115402437 isoform X2 [Salarias fasciatus]